MFIAFNIVVIALAGLIAYWWANQGFLSAVLHFVCVVCAGAIAFAVWEPLTVNYLLTGGAFDKYAWTTSLLGVFAVTLLVLRFISDKVVPENLNVPDWANYVFGGLFGAASGVLTIGIFLIGAGFAQSTVELMGFVGEARVRAGGQPQRVQSLWVPVHRITANFYSFVSAGSLAPTFTRSSLQRHYPNLDGMAMSLYRDSARDGTGVVSIAPDAMRVESFAFSPSAVPGVPASGAVAIVRLRFELAAYDRGERLRLTASQARLIGRAGAGRWSEPAVAHPTAWIAPVMVAGVGLAPGVFRFDDLSHVATSVPGQQSTTIALIFPASGFGNTPPEFIQVKGVRFRLPTAQTGPEGVMTVLAETLAAVVTGGGDLDSSSMPTGLGAAGGGQGAPAIPTVTNPLALQNQIPNLILSKNQLSGWSVEDNYLASGRQEFMKTGGMFPGAALRIKGIYEPPGTRVMQLDVSRGISPIDIYGDTNQARNEAGDRAPLVLVDENDMRYQPIGYIWERPENIEIRLDPSRGFSRVGDLPFLPTARTHRLWVIFRVTEGVTIVDVQLGNISVGRVNVTATGGRF